MAYRLNYSDYPTSEGPPDPLRWVGPPGPPGPPGPVGPLGGEGAIISVLDHGAKGDGTTDDTAAIQAALNAYAGKATVFVPDTGNAYMVSPLMLPTGTDMLLTGTLKCRAGSTQTPVDIVSASNVTIRGNGAIDGNASAQTPGNNMACLYVYQSSNVKVTGIALRNAYTWPLNILQSSRVWVDKVTISGGVSANGFAQGDDCWLTGCNIDGTNNGDYGFCFYGGVTNSGAIGNVVRNCGAGTGQVPPGIGVLSDAGSPNPCSNIVIADNVSHDNAGSGVSVLASGAAHSRIIIANNVYRNNNKTGTGAINGADIFLQAATDVTVIGNQSSANGNSAGTAFGISMASNVSGITITGNQISDTGQGTTTGVGIWNAGASNVYISGNHVFDDQTTPTMQYAATGSAGQNNVYVGNCFARPLNFTQAADTISVNAVGGGLYRLGPHTVLGSSAPQQIMNVAQQLRWYIGQDGSTETGTGNTGSNFAISGVYDNGALQTSALVINRATGQVTLATVPCTVPPGGSIQAAIDALPATGGMVVLSSNTTYVVTTAISSSTPNVHLSAPGRGTIIQRGPTLGGTMLLMSGSGCLIEGMTFDGNGTVNTSGSTEVQISGANSRITNVQCINSASTVTIAASGAGCRVDHCTIAGLGASLSTQRGYGIWAINHVQVFIEHNKITGTGIDAIGADGPGTVVNGNSISGCHCYTGGGGGQLAIYAGPGIVISNNYIGQGGGTSSGGVELSGNYVMFTGNTVVNQYGGGVAIEAGHGFTISGNTIQNVGLDMSGAQDGIVVFAGITDFVITGNRIGDDNATPNMRWPIVVSTGASDRFVIAGNLLLPNSQANFRIADGSTGVNKVIHDNTGQDTMVPSYVTSATSVSIPTTMSVFHLQNSGVLTITSITAASRQSGAVKVALPNAAFTFVAGNNINNALTTVAGVPFTMTCDDIGNWWLK